MVWFNTKCLWALHYLSRGKPRGIKPEFPNKELGGVIEAWLLKMCSAIKKGDILYADGHLQTLRCV
jgi:hypothetical protein